VYLPRADAGALLARITALSAPVSGLATEYFSRARTPEIITLVKLGERDHQAIPPEFGGADAPQVWLCPANT
jgi:hypothetical protein